MAPSMLHLRGAPVLRRFDHEGTSIDETIHAVRLSSRVETGRLETYALDSQRCQCVWHRVFVEACVPPGTAITLDARTADALYPDARMARSPVSGEETAERWEHAPALGSRTPDDDEGWLPVGTLDLRPAWADVVFAPPAPDGLVTLEGLLKNPPGRYLWLRVRLVGTTRRTPSVAALRVTFPRPSLLEHLPAFWREDPERAAAMDQVLALFEGMLREIDSRVEALPSLFDPRVCPADALDWLAGFIGLAFDLRLPEGKRRSLLREGAQLFRQRGTVAGLVRLGEIVTGAKVEIVEAFRQHRFTVVVRAARDDELSAVLDSMVERSKPAHTVHTIEWLPGS